MEPITAGLFAILFVALGNHMKEQELKINNLEQWNYRLSGELSSLSAREKVNDDLQKRQIEYLLKEAMSNN